MLILHEWQAQERYWTARTFWVIPCRLRMLLPLGS